MNYCAMCDCSRDNHKPTHCRTCSCVRFYSASDLNIERWVQIRRDDETEIWHDTQGIPWSAEFAERSSTPIHMARSKRELLQIIRGDITHAIQEAYTLAYVGLGGMTEVVERDVEFHRANYDGLSPYLADFNTPVELLMGTREIVSMGRHNEEEVHLDTFTLKTPRGTFTLLAVNGIIECVVTPTTQRQWDRERRVRTREWIEDLETHQDLYGKRRPIY